MNSTRYPLNFASRRTLLRAGAIAAAAVVLGSASGCAGFDFTSAEERRVRTVVTAFGERMQTVSLLAPTVAADLRQAYAPYATPELLAAWVANPQTAPGRVTSSPWPDSIAIQQIERARTNRYTVTGEVVLRASTGEAGRIPVSLTVEQRGGVWLVSAYQQAPQ